MQRTVLIAMLSVLVGLVGQAQSARVTVQETAQPLHQLVKSLSERTGERLRVSRELADEIVLVEVADAPLETLLDALAQALDARWIADYDGARRLTRTASLRQRRIQHEQERLLQRLKQSLDRDASERWDEIALRKRLIAAREAMLRVQTAVPAATPRHRLQDIPQVQQLYKLVNEQLNPDRRLLQRLVLRLGIARLLETPIDERRVYGNLRGRFVQPLPFDPSALLEQFIKERNLLTALWWDTELGVHEAHEQLSERYELELGAVRLQPFARETLPLQRVECAPEEILVLLEVGRPTVDGLVLRLHLFGREGALIGVTDWHLYADAPIELNTAAWLDAPVRWSESTRRALGAWQRVLQLFQEGGGDYEPPAEADPARVEPLSLAVADYIRARAQGKPFVALLHDELIGRQFVLTDCPPLRDRAPLREYLPFVRAMEAELELTEGEIVLAKPRWAAHWWGKRFSRSALRQQMERIRARGYLNLDDISEIARFTPNLCTDAVRCWLRLNGIDEQYQLGADSRVWSALSERTRALLEHNAPLTVADLTPEERYALHYQVYYRWGLGVGFYEIHKNLPTDLMHYYLPDGLPLDALIALRTYREAGVWAVRIGAVWNRFLSYNAARAISEDAPEDSSEEDPDKDIRLALQQPVPHGARSKLILDVRLPPPVPIGAIRITDATDYHLLSRQLRPWRERPTPDEPRQSP